MILIDGLNGWNDRLPIVNYEHLYNSCAYQKKCFIVRGFFSEIQYFCPEVN